MLHASALRFVTSRGTITIDENHDPERKHTWRDLQPRRLDARLCVVDGGYGVLFPTPARGEEVTLSAAGLLVSTKDLLARED